MVIDEDESTQQKIEATMDNEPTNEELAPKEKDEHSKLKIRSTFNSFPFIPNKLLFPQRYQKKKVDVQLSKFLGIFKKLQINTPFIEALV